ncbi:MAG TPA: carboxylating nicotinate-nucleotide diphosphorylase [Planctomycetes bacterium]|nr:carboxylating nicotinate-nucleotide diphosphorylase [Planctomycetota bacterium]
MSDENKAHEDEEEDLFEHSLITALVSMAIGEDLGPEGDVTSRIIPHEANCRAEVVFREDGVLAGLPLVPLVLERLGRHVTFEATAEEGARLSKGDVVGVLSGNARQVLMLERTLLNLLQRMSGTASATRRFVDAIEGTAAKLLDTRKTIPGWRLLQKYAVTVGGGVNHRMGLHDMVLIKDNHLAVHGGEEAVGKVVELARQQAPGIPLEIEVTTLAGALAAAQAGADYVLLDNFTPAQLAEIVEAVHADAKERGAEPPQLEASGGINLETVRAVAESGVDRISTGWITHSAPSLDIALDFKELG